MRKNITSIFFGAVGTALLLMSDSFAGTLTVTSGPDFDPPGAFSNNSIAVQQVDVDLVKIFGDATIAITPDTQVTIMCGGTFTADQSDGDKFSVFYDFTIDLNSIHPVDYTVEGTIFGQPFGESGTVNPGSTRYTGTFESPPTPADFNGNWDGTLTLTFGNANPLPSGPQADPETLDIHIEQVLVQVAPTTVVPEPSTVAFLGVGLGALVVAMRRRRATTVA